MRLLLGFLNVVMTLIFLTSVLVQYNDPDALPWMAVYGSAAAACIAFAMGRLRWFHAAVVGLVSLLWAAAMAPLFWGHVALDDLFGTLDMKTQAVERAREFGGLVIVCIWMTILALRLRLTKAVETPVGGVGT